MNRAEVAMDVAARLGAAERAIDEAVRAGADLLGRLATARGELDLSAVVGGEAFERSTAALAALSAARAETAACHDVLSRVQVRAGLGAVATGQGGKTPPPSAHVEGLDAGAAVRRLRA